MNTQDKIIIHNKCEIIHKTGYVFLQYIFENDTDIILDKIKLCVDKYINLIN